MILLCIQSCHKVFFRTLSKSVCLGSSSLIFSALFQTSPDGNVTTSTLTFSPQVDDSGKSLTCRAENRHISGSAQEDTWTLNVHCKYRQLVTEFYVSSIHLLALCLVFLLLTSTVFTSDLLLDMQEIGNAFRISVEKPEEKISLWRSRRGWQDNIEMSLWVTAGRCRLDSRGWGQGPVAGCRQHDSEPSGSLKDGELLE
jgi:hypothetical protein